MDIQYVDQEKKKDLDTDHVLRNGVERLKEHAMLLPDQPGVYIFKSLKNEVLYVGKAKQLKKRVWSYTRVEQLPVRKQRMVSLLDKVDTHITSTETEALLLEANLIKKHCPPYNILLKDDKSFPYLHLTGDREFPQLKIYRGSRKNPGDYFGPFASGTAVHETYEILQKIFLLRTCSDGVFSNRSRPCLLYDIKRCSGPCTGKISKEKYTDLLRDVKSFFRGNSRELQEKMRKEMCEASMEQHYEKAAVFRDRIKSLTRIQEHQVVNVAKANQDFHVHALAREHGKACIEVSFYQAGQHFGSKAYFPNHVYSEDTDESIMEAFIMQFYEKHTPPEEIILSRELSKVALLRDALSFRAGKKIKVTSPKIGIKAQVVQLALKNSIYHLRKRIKESLSFQESTKEFQELLQIDKPLEKIEAYDNSHLFGESAYGVMIVTNKDGFNRAAYRKFRIKEIYENSEGVTKKIKSNDDFAMMMQVMVRRFKEKNEEARALWPDVMLIDGGLGQLRVVEDFFKRAVFSNLPKNSGIPRLVAIAKGPNRNAGEETLYLDDGRVISLPKSSNLLFFLQRLRDESHRFALSTHKRKRDKKVKKSMLDNIPGVGAKRKKALLEHFGSAQEVARASFRDLKLAAGISSPMAEVIYNHFHDGE